MTTIGNVTVKYLPNALGSYLLNMTTTGNVIRSKDVQKQGSYLLNMTTIENDCIAWA